MWDNIPEEPPKAGQTLILKRCQAGASEHALYEGKPRQQGLGLCRATAGGHQWKGGVIRGQNHRIVQIMIRCS